MALPSQQIRAGLLQSAWRAQLDKLTAAGAAAKIWSKQADLWTTNPAHAEVIRNRLGWIPVVDQMRAELPALASFVHDVRAAGLEHCVLLGMGGSSLAPEVFSLTFPPPSASARFFVLDSTDPGAVLDIERSIDLRSTLFIVASKSGKTIETLSQFSYFHKRFADLGARTAGQHFIAITDQGSHLEQLAAQHAFRKTFLNPADIGGRYSALSYFGLVPAALWGVDLGALLDSADTAREACGPSAKGENPAVALGALLGAGALNGLDRLILLSTPKLVPLGNWIEQLIAESTGKQEKGIVPVAGGSFPPAETLAEGCIIAALRLRGDSNERLDRALKEIGGRDVVVVEIELAAASDLGAEFFKWEVATAAAGAVLGIDPFDEPNVQESKDNTARILQEFEKLGEIPVPAAQFTESGIEVYMVASGSAGPPAPAHLAETLRVFFNRQKSGDYLALLAYLERDLPSAGAGASTARQIDALRDALDAHLRIPVLLGYGPRYMHSIGQLYKGGPPTGMFLILTSSKAHDAPIPGANYTFAQLQLAQALGDMQSLAKRNKPVLRLHFTQGVKAGLEVLRQVVEQALAAVRPAGR